MLREPLLKGLQVSFAIIVDAGLVVPGVESQSGVSSDLEASNFVGGRVKLGNHQVTVVSVVLAEFFPNGGKRLAVAAPWGVVFDEHVLGRVHNDRFEGCADHDGDGALGLGLGLALQMHGKLAGFEVINKRLDGAYCKGLDGATEHELSHFLTGGKETDCWRGGGIDTDELCESLLNALLSAGDNEQDLSLQLASSVRKDFVVAGLSVVREQDKSFLSFPEDGLNEILRKFNKGGNRGVVHPFAERG